MRVPALPGVFAPEERWTDDAWACPISGDTEPQPDRRDRRPKRTLKNASAAANCGLGKSTLDKLRRTGGGPALSKLNAVVVHDVTDLDASMAANRHTSTSEHRNRSG